MFIVGGLEWVADRMEEILKAKWRYGEEDRDIDGVRKYVL